MLVSDILNNIEHQMAYNATAKIDVTDISADSRAVKAGSLFFAYKGETFDSHDKARELYLSGTVAAVVSERELKGVPSILVKDGRKAFSAACRNFFGRADEKLIMIAVTGTNGKTTISWILDKIFRVKGVKTVLIGTTGAYVVGKEYELNNTTPSPYDFNRLLAEGVEKGAEVAITEVSSHALSQGRIYGITFDVAIFTNLTGDHLDYHKDMENYYHAKKLLFSPEFSNISVINTDDAYGKRLFNEVKGEKYSYGIEKGDLSARDFRMDLKGMMAKIEFKGKTFDIKSPLVGRYNFENILAAVTAALALNVKSDSIAKALSAMPNVPGRLERYSSNGVTVFVDYAHTDDALLNVLLTLKNVSKGRLITVFGAGGDRDKTKRPRMGKVAQEYSDIVIVTTDNPRTESPQDIINDILKGMNKSVVLEIDREKAIVKAIEQAQEGDIVLIAGKGHENYQIVGDIKHPFSDSAVVQEALKSKRG